STSGWHHVVVSWDLETTTAYVIVDKIDVTNVNSITNDTIDYTDGDFAIGARVGGANPFNGSLAQFWFDDQFMDVSDPDILRKFVRGTSNTRSSSVTWSVADMGASGEGPTGSSPVIYLTGEAADWVTNLGT